MRPFVREIFPIDDSVLVIGPQPEPRAMTAIGVGPPPVASLGTRERAPRFSGSVRRIVCASILFVSVTMLVFSALDQSAVGLSVFSAAALGSLIVLAIPPRS
jgi:hypothetical protein